MHIKRFFLLQFLLVFWPFLSVDANDKPREPIEPFTVVLDAGHGGHDPGNLGNGYMEKNIALNIVLEVGKWLEKQPDIKVVYTRKTDSFVDLFMRGKIANDANADLFVSVHCDSHSSDAHGAGTFVLGLHANEQNFEIAKKENSVIYLEDDYETRYAEYDINSPESIIGLTIMQEEFLDQSIALAKLMQDEFTGRLKRNDRKVKQAGFIVLHQTFMPSVLIETGFLTNKNEGSYLNSSRGQSEMGKAIAEAIIAYKQNVRSQPAALITSTAPAAAIKNPVPVETTKEQVVVNNSTSSIKPQAKKAEEESKDTGEAGKALVEKEIKAPQTVASKDANTTAAQSPANREVVSGELAMNRESPARPKAVENENTPPAIDTNDAAVEKDASGNVVFKIQLLASSRDLPLRPGDFKGLGRLSKEPYKNLYRYFYGNTSSYREAQLLKSNADMKGYTTSFIVAYKDGVRIPVEEAMKYVKD